MTFEDIKRMKETRGYDLVQLAEHCGVSYDILELLFCKEDICDLPQGTSKRVEEAMSYATDREKRQGEYRLERRELGDTLTFEAFNIEDKTTRGTVMATLK